MTQDAQALTELLDHYGNRTLSSGGRDAFNRLISVHEASILAALAQENAIAIELGATNVSESSGSPTSPAFQVAAKLNLQLCNELISSGANPSRPAEIIAPELLASAAELRRALRNVILNPPQSP